MENRALKRKREAAKQTEMEKKSVSCFKKLFYEQIFYFLNMLSDNSGTRKIFYRQNCIESK